MRKKTLKSRFKPYFCYDENQEFLRLKKECNKMALFKSIIQVMGKQGAKDREIIKECNKLDYHVITHNTKDFRNPYPKIKIGIICIGLKEEENWVNKFIQLIKKMPKHKNYIYKTIIIGNAITIKNRQNNKIEIL